MNNLNDCLYDCPVIPAVKDEEYIEQCLKSDSEIVFVLYGNICSISDICKLIKESGKKCIVHADLINGLAGKEIAADFIKKYTEADGLISTRTPVIKRAKEIGLYTVLRQFVIDSMSYENIAKTVDACHPHAVEILPGPMPTVIADIVKAINAPVIAGGLITKKSQIIELIERGAVSVSTSARNLWE